MRDDPQSIISTARVQQEACNMLDKRKVQGEDEPWDVPWDALIDRLWSLRRGNYLVVHAVKVNKDAALLLMKHAKENHLVVIFNECTPAARKLLRSADNIEAWNVKELCVHPFKFSYIVDAGIELRPYPAEAEKLPKLLYDDPVRRYLGAKHEDLVWIKIQWGSLGVGRHLRYVE